MLPRHGGTLAYHLRYDEPKVGQIFAALFWYLISLCPSSVTSG
jgi:hypothetical protein